MNLVESSRVSNARMGKIRNEYRIYSRNSRHRVIHAHSLEQATWCIASEAVSSCLGQFSWSFRG